MIIDTVQNTGAHFTVGERNVTKAEVHDLSYAELIACIDKAQSRGLSGVEYTIAVERQRFIKQCKFYAGDKEIAIAPENIATMPTPFFRQLRKAMFASKEQPGKVVKKGDGVTGSIIFELGTPIKTQGGGEIKELEFIAETVEQIETVMYQADTSRSVLELLRTVAQPLGTWDDTEQLLALPEWAVDKITIVDAVAIQNTVLPSFLE